MHELTGKLKLLKDSTADFPTKEDIWIRADETIVSYMKEQAEQLKRQSTKISYPGGVKYTSIDEIYHAFGLSTPTLEEKLKELMSGDCIPSEQHIIKLCIELCREHFKENPDELK